ncbi:unnamed protein product [Macrosiphum euphorbiae]|uniref:Uncharacterized protein n=1 Tax=Macrosiphum euphorbiae TaxID=13131 RepID=A0AAV0WKP3_9HEMI|nr:unnamed protein product [Macrosiphum euphorbiae]
MLMDGGAHALDTRIRTRHARAFGPFPRTSLHRRALRPTIVNCTFVPSASERYQSLAYTDGRFDFSAASGNTAQIPLPPVVTGLHLDFYSSTIPLCSPFLSRVLLSNPGPPLTPVTSTVVYRLRE